ncbi:MAG TPA: hypothetical protein VFO10_10880 [Oligoflexus sp.]|uniref:hypothetical protein n=1 Tax=Oligoflexus sp. TaxID=1971216 RepID=UPI002D810F30|nr:hypothetical protein [Oligoflexus sp.]HET9237748.1 hypothetical protein [Oligoflexus sp.]
MKGQLMHQKVLTLTLLLSLTALACRRNSPPPPEAGQDRFPNSNTTVPPGDTGFQDGTFAHPDGDKLRFEGKAVEESPCADNSRPGQDQTSIDETCPDQDIKPLVPLSAPTPSEMAKPAP